jgi:hypothetical protein
MAGKPTKKSIKKAAVEDEELDEEGEEEEEEAEVEAAPPPAARSKRAASAPLPAGEFRWEDPSSLRQLDAKWVLLWFVVPIIAVIVYGLLVSN